MAQETIHVIEAGRSPSRTVLKLALPTIVEQIMLTLVQFVDTAMVGALGAAATASIAACSSTIWLINGVMGAAGVGFTVLVARAIGLGDRDRAKDVVRQSILTVLVLGLALTGISQLIAGPLPHWIGTQQDVGVHTTNYLRIVSSVFLLHTGSQIFSSILRGAGDVKTPMVLNIITNILNIVLNLLLIFETKTYHIFGVSVTLWGAGMGVEGAATATAISTGVIGLLILLTLFLKNSPIRVSLRDRFRFDGAIISDMVRIGLPAGLERVTLSLGQVVFTMLVSGLGTIPLAAHHLAVTAESISYMPASGVSVAATTLVGQSLGAGRKDLALRFSKICNIFGIVFMTLAGVVLFLFPGPLMSIFTRDTEVIAYGVDTLRIVAFAEPFFAASMVSFGILRGAGDTKWPFYISIVSMWGVRILSAWVLAYPLGLGLAGIWLGMALDLVVRGILSLARVRSKKWMGILDGRP